MVAFLRYVVFSGLVLQVFFASLVQAQISQEGNHPKIIPPSPQAAALEKYGSTPVGVYTGVPSIEVPLYEINVRDLRLPISLSYHAGGFRVTDEASWAGLGWTLQAGGAITRTVRDQDDLLYYLSGNNPQMIDFTCVAGSGPIQVEGLCQGNRYTGGYGMHWDDNHVSYVNGQLIPYHWVWEAGNFTDWEPDDFRFNFLNYSGQFVYNQQRQLRLIQQQKLRIEYRNDPDGNGLLWEVSAPDGSRYFFGANERTGVFGRNPETSVTAWYLTKVISPWGEELTLTYEEGPRVLHQPSLTQYQNRAEQNCGSSANSSPTLGASYSSSASYPRYLTRIDYRTGYVEFERETAVSRLDLEGAQRLNRIVVHKRNGEILKSFTLGASYFETPDGGNDFSQFPNLFKDKRLRLDQVTETSASGLAKPPTTFTYNATPLPSKTSYSVDYWGYNNGRVNTTLMPRFAGTVPGFGYYAVYPGANREPEAAAMQACVLQKITYPTGGSTLYQFEPNDYSNFSDQERYEKIGSNQVQVYRDNTYPYRNRTAEPFVITLENSSNGVEMPVVDLLMNATVGNPSEVDSKARTYVELVGSNGYRQVWNFNSFPYLSLSTTAIHLRHSVRLAPGTYTLTAHTPVVFEQTGRDVRISCDISYDRYVRRTKKTGGGLRIAQIMDRPGSSQSPPQVWKYQYTDEQRQPLGSYSHGILMSPPQFHRQLEVPENCMTFRTTSYSNTYLSNGAKGSLIGYSKVIVQHGANSEKGKTVYSFLNAEDRLPDYHQRVPNVPTRYNPFNGYLSKEEFFTKNDTDFQLVKSTSHAYDSVNTKDVPAIYRGEKWAKLTGTSAQIFGQQLYYYPIQTGWVRKIETATQLYDAHRQAYTASTTRYDYDMRNTGHMQISQQTTRRSDGSTVLTSTTYPADYPGVASGPLAQMRSDAVFQHNAVVESLARVYQAGQTEADAKTIGGSYTEYVRPNTTAKYLPSTQQKLALARPTAGLAVATPNLPPAGRYKVKSRFDYDALTANLQQVQKDKDTPTAYVWGYQHTLPVASVQNASASQVQAALTALSIDVNTLSTDEQLRTAFARLRQRLPLARITSFTHQPLVGMTSQTDPAGRTTYYEYDEFNRLKRVRDEQGHVLSEQEYRYASQP